MTEVALRIEDRNGQSPLRLSVDDLIIAGWTGRDAAAMEAHVQELEALGVARPKSMPMYYRISPDRLTTAPAISVTGEHSSGEVEFVLFAAGGKLYVGAGSDHTDRKVEAYGITVSKQLCDKPVATAIWPYDQVADHWEELVLRSHVVVNGKRRLYQEGKLARLLPPEELIGRLAGDGDLTDGTVLFGGTIPAQGGVQPAERFEGELEDPVLDHLIRFAYDIRTLPIEE